MYIIRHGESLGNAGLSTEPNTDLSPLGEIQAKLVADFFRNIPVTTIYSSPFFRAIQTAAPLAKDKNIPIILVPEMTEIFKTEWTEKERNYAWESWDEIERRYPFAKFIDKYDRTTKWWPDWPEEREDVDRRVRPFYDEELYPLRSEYSHIVVFGHGASTSALRRIIHPDTKLPPIKTSNAVIFEYLFSDAGCVDYKVHYEFLGRHQGDPNKRNY